MKKRTLLLCLGLSALVTLAGCGRKEAEIAVYRDGKGKNYTQSVNFFNTGIVACYENLYGEECLETDSREIFYIGNPLKDGWIIPYESEEALSPEQNKKVKAFAGLFLSELNKRKLPKEIKSYSDKKDWVRKISAEIVFKEETPLNEKYEELKEFITLKWPFLIIDGKLIAISDDYNEYLSLVKQKKNTVKANNHRRVMKYKFDDYSYTEFGTNDSYASYDSDDDMIIESCYYLGDAYRDGWIIVTDAESKKDVDRSDIRKLESALEKLNKVKIPAYIKSTHDYETFVDNVGEYMIKQKLFKDDEEFDSAFTEFESIDHAMFFLVRTLPNGKKALVSETDTYPEKTAKK